MKLIQPEANPFFFITNVLDACIARSAFHAEELNMIADARLVMNYMGSVMQAIEDEDECDCGKELAACNGSCESEEQLELPL